MKTSILIAATLLVLVLVLPVSAQENMANRDDILKADIYRIVGNHVFYTIYDAIEVNVDGGVVTLSGYVTEPFKKNSIFKAIKKRTSGEVSINDQVEVLPVSSSDNRLRYLLARSIYNDSRLLRYSLDRWPYPIHIIVRNGKVTLVGEVKTKMDSRIIESNVHRVFGIVSLKNNLKISKS